MILCFFFLMCWIWLMSDFFFYVLGWSAVSFVVTIQCSCDVLIKQCLITMSETFNVCVVGFFWSLGLNSLYVEGRWARMPSKNIIIQFTWNMQNVFLNIAKRNAVKASVGRLNWPCWAAERLWLANTPLHSFHKSVDSRRGRFPAYSSIGQKGKEWERILNMHREGFANQAHIHEV